MWEGRRIFPPEHLDQAVADAINEIIERPNPPRRLRSCPRVVKRQRYTSYRIKRGTDSCTRHTEEPAIQIIAPAA